MRADAEDIAAPSRRSGRRLAVMRVKARDVRNALAREIRIYRLIMRHDRTPRVARWLLGAALAYAVSPLDLIPDWIPVVGHLDDILIVPLLVWLSLRFVPAGVIAECRARETLDDEARAP